MTYKDTGLRGDKASDNGMRGFDTGGSAFPIVSDCGQRIENSEGMTLRQYAAIKLKVPDSGTDWLDKMIEQSLQNDFAAKAMANCGDVVTKPYSNIKRIAEDSFQLASEMLKARKA